MRSLSASAGMVSLACLITVLVALCLLTSFDFPVLLQNLQKQTVELRGDLEILHTLTVFLYPYIHASNVPAFDFEVNDFSSLFFVPQEASLLHLSPVPLPFVQTLSG